MEKLPETNRIRIATIFSYGVNEAENDDFVVDENSENTDGLDQSSWDFLESAIDDYNRLFSCADIGMSLSTALNIYLKELGREKRIPFEVSVDPFYSKENMTRLKEPVAQVEATGGTVQEMDFDD